MATETRYAGGNTTIAAGCVNVTEALGAPDGTYTGNTDNTNWTERFSIGDPTNPLTAGATDHTVTVTLRKSAAGGNGNPTCDVQLYDNGTLVRSLSGGALAVSDGTTSFSGMTFTTAEVSSAANVEIVIAVVGQGGTPAGRRNVQVDGITVDFNTTAGSTPNTGNATGTHAWAGSATGSNGGGGGVKNLPALIGAADSNVEQESHSYNPVYADANGNLYTVTESVLASNNQPRAMKSTDGGETWAEVDAANRPGTDSGGIGDLESGWITQEPGYITFTWARSYPAYSRFRTSDHPTNPDTWEDNDREAVGSGEGAPQFMSHTSPTDQSYQWMFWANGSAVSYCSRPYGADTTEGSTQTLDATGGAPAAWLDDANVSHVLYRKSNELHYKTLTSGGTLQGTSTRVDTNGLNAQPISHTRPVPFTSGGDSVVTCVFTNASGQLRAVDIVNGTPGAEQTITNNAVTHNPADTLNESAVISADVDGTTVHVVWSDNATGDLMHSERPYGGSWTTPDTVQSPSVGVYWVYCKVIDYVGTGKVLGIRYSDGFDSVGEVNDIYYDEVALAALGQGNVTGTHAWAGTATGIKRNVSEWSATVQATTLSGANNGTASGTHAWSGTATGARNPAGTATGTHAWAGAATGARNPAGAATGTHEWAGAATGARAPEGNGTGTHAWSGVANGAAALQGNATGTHEHTGTATGAAALQGNVTGTHQWAGAATGARASEGAAAGNHTWTGAADGARPSSAAASGTHEWAGTATGTAPLPGVNDGSATGTHSWAGTATGARDSAGGAVATHAWSGGANGSAPTRGGATGTHAWAGTATGSAPTVAGRSGGATGTHAWAGAATGARPSTGLAVGSHVWSGVANGGQSKSGNVTGTHEWAGTATGARVSRGSATGTHEWAGRAGINVDITVSAGASRKALAAGAARFGLAVDTARQVSPVGPSRKDREA